MQKTNINSTQRRSPTPTINLESRRRACASGDDACGDEACASGDEAYVSGDEACTSGDEACVSTFTLRQDHLHLAALYPAHQHFFAVDVGMRNTFCAPTLKVGAINESDRSVCNAEKSEGTKYTAQRKRVNQVQNERANQVHRRTKASEPSSRSNEAGRGRGRESTRYRSSQGHGAAELPRGCERTQRQDPDRSPRPPPPPLPALVARHRSPHLPVTACPCANTPAHAGMRIQ
jgi:hypothetical protein